MSATLSKRSLVAPRIQGIVKDWDEFVTRSQVGQENWDKMLFDQRGNIVKSSESC